MNINLFTFFAQIVNFLILLYILNRVVFKPLMKAVNDRKNSIDEKITNAENKLNEAQELKEKIQQEYNKFEEYKNTEEEKIAIEINNEKDKQIQRMNEELKNEKDVFAKQLELEKDNIIYGISKNICGTIGKFVDNVFLSLSNTTLQESSTKKFLEEISKISDDDLKKIKMYTDEKVVFYSNYELSDKLKYDVKQAFKGIGVIGDISFEIDDKLVFGNKVAIGSLIINSNVEDIVAQFTNNLKESI